MYGCESWTIKKGECCRIDAFDLERVKILSDLVPPCLSRFYSSPFPPHPLGPTHLQHLKVPFAAASLTLFSLKLNSYLLHLGLYNILHVSK